MDTIGDFLTTIRNASNACLGRCTSQWSRVRESITKLLLREGFIAGYSIVDDKNGHKVLEIQLKYVEGMAAITEIKRHSKPGRRLYYSCAKIPKVLGGLGVAILTTSKGIMTDKEARVANLGGELICKAW